MSCAPIISRCSGCRCLPAERSTPALAAATKSSSANRSRGGCGDRDPVGRRLRDAASDDTPAQAAPWQTVVGVVGDAALLALGEDRDTPAIYYPSGEDGY